MVPVTIHGAPSAEHSLRALAGDTLVGACTGSCTLWVPPGQYRLTVEDDVHGGRRTKVDAFHPVTVVVEPGNPRARTFGLVLGIGGITVAVTGVYMVVFGLAPAFPAGAGHGGTSDDDDIDDALVTAGLVLMAAGGVATPVGWSTFGSNKTQITTHPSTSTGTAPPAALRLDVGPGSLNVTASF
jgi:hypothetical protein